MQVVVQERKSPLRTSRFHPKNGLCVYFWKAESKKRVMKRLGSVVMSTLAFKSQKLSKNWFLEPYKPFVHPTSMRPIFGTYTTLSTTLFHHIWGSESSMINTQLWIYGFFTIFRPTSELQRSIKNFHYPFHYPFSHHWKVQNLNYILTYYDYSQKCIVIAVQTHFRKVN